MTALAPPTLAAPTTAPAVAAPPPASLPASAPTPSSRPPLPRRPIAEGAPPRVVGAKAAIVPITLATPVVVFGTGPRGGLCAGRFRACDAAFALAAGRDAGLRVLRAGPEHAALIKPIKRGHLFGDGRAVLPAAKEALIAALTLAADKAGEGANLRVEVPEPDAVPAVGPCEPARGVAASLGDDGAEVGRRPPARLPAGGADGGDGLLVGALVLALDEEDGEAWFEAEVTRRLADGRLRLRWRGYPELKAFTRPAEELAPLPLPFATAAA